MEVRTGSPVDLEVTAPDGRSIARQLVAIPGASYMELTESTGHSTNTVLIPFPLNGNYRIKVLPKPGASPTDTYTLTVTRNDISTVLAQEQQIQDIPSQDFIVPVIPSDQTVADTECLLNWAERNYPALFAPSGSPTAIWDVYTYRYYSATNAYVGVSSTDKHVYYMGTDGILQDVGPLSDWLPKADCQPPPPVDCLFNWAENNYPGLFAPSGAPTAIWDVYTYRYYSATKAYVGVSSADNHVYYMGADGRLLDEGALSDWLPRAGCQ